MKLRFPVELVWIGATLSAAHADTLFAVGPDPSTSIPDQLVSVTLSPQAVNTIATLGSGLLGFNGGLTAGPGGGLYAIANDFTGAGSFYTVQPNGALGLVGAAGGLGLGFLGGLAYDTGNSTFYAAANDTGGNAALYSITAAGVAAATGLSLGTGFSGLAYDSANGLFYGIGNDSTGYSTLYDFPLGGPVNSVGGLGFGFGALTFDAANNVLWALDPVNNLSSQLFQISTAGTVSPPYFTLGDGFAELAAVAASQGVPSPEPATAAALGAGIAWFACLLKRRKQ